ncbi:MAG: MarR family transcriptional regulator [Gammaproteobacteria bacterium]|jgi:DNA-binding MarR family transcriptional regulator
MKDKSLKVLKDKNRSRKKDESLLFSYLNEIGIIAQLANNEFERNLPDGLTVSQFSVLNWFVRVDSEATPGRLADAFQVTAGAMTNTLKKLASKGFVRLEPDASSGRRKRVTLTRKGREMRERAIACTSPLLAEFGQAMNAMDFEQQLKQLRQVRTYFDTRRYS